MGTDPERPPERILTAPRYAAMEHSSTAGPGGAHDDVQHRVDPGQRRARRPKPDRQRWCLANRWRRRSSPLRQLAVRAGGPSGWQSTRMRAWWPARPDPHRRPVHRRRSDRRVVDYALDARVMLDAQGRRRHRAGDRRAHLRRVAGRGPRAGLARPRRSRLPPHHVVPAGAAQGLVRAPHVRRAAHPVLAGGRGRDRALLTDGHRPRPARRAEPAPRAAGSTPPSSGSAIPRCRDRPSGVFDVAARALARHGRRRRRRRRSSRATPIAGSAAAARPADDRLDAWRRDGDAVARRPMTPARRTADELHRRAGASRAPVEPSTPPSTATRIAAELTGPGPARWPWSTSSTTATLRAQQSRPDVADGLGPRPHRQLRGAVAAARARRAACRRRRARRPLQRVRAPAMDRPVAPDPRRPTRPAAYDADVRDEVLDLLGSVDSAPTTPSRCWPTASSTGW